MRKVLTRIFFPCQALVCCLCFFDARARDRQRRILSCAKSQKNSKWLSVVMILVCLRRDFWKRNGERLLSQNLSYHSRGLFVREAEFAAAAAVDEFGVIEAEEMQNGRMIIMMADDVLDRMMAPLIG